MKICIVYINQYNIIAVKKDKEINIKNIHCLPHGKDEKYKEIKDQIIDFSYVWSKRNFTAKEQLHHYF